jgi:hypothetical protein
LTNVMQHSVEVAEYQAVFRSEKEKSCQIHF